MIFSYTRIKARLSRGIKISLFRINTHIASHMHLKFINIKIQHVFSYMTNEDMGSND